MIDGCFLKCIGRILINLVDPQKITHIDALPHYQKFTDVFDIDDVPEAERQETARQVAEKILPELRAAVASHRAATPELARNAEAGDPTAREGCGGGSA
jgi:hypothetical protein